MADLAIVDTLITYGGTVKVLEKKGDLVTIGGPAVVFDDPASPKKDLTGDYFTKDTYLGAHKGNGVDVLFHHGFPVAGLKAAQAIADYIFPPVKTEQEDMYLLASVVMDMRKDYERFAVEQAEAKTLGWSTGSAGHMVKRESDGQIKRWPIIEISLTPTPAEPRTSAMPLKSLLAAEESVTEEELKLLSMALSFHNLNLRTRIRG